MVLSSLLEGRFQQYFDEILSRSPVWLFVHIPKTAGSSLNGELVPILSPNHHIFIDYTKLDRQSFADLLDEAVGRFLDLAATRRYAYCTGHLTAEQVSRITVSVPNVRPMTLLRDPVARFVSDYRYQCSPMHTGHEQFRAAHPVIDSYLDVPGEWNKAAAHLIPPELRDTGDAAKCVEHVLAQYSFVGIQESYALSLRLITTLAGAPRRPAVFKRVNTPTSETAIELTASTEALIRERNALDIGIYETLAARFRGIEEGLIGYLDRVDPLGKE